jgi:Flp pilus assembly pilin Flp
MKNLRRYFEDLFWYEKGAAAVEYGLLISCIAAVIAVSVGLFGGAVQQLYQNAVDSFPK